MFKLRAFLGKIFPKNTAESVIFLEVLLGIVVSVASLIIFLLITNAVLEKETVLVDKSISNFFYSLRNPALTRFMFLISLFGEEIILAGSVLVIILLTRRKHKRETFIFPILLLMGLAVSTILKIILKVPRPTVEALVKLNSYSFPSGHSVNSFLFYAAIAYFIFHFTRKKLISIAVSLGAVIMILAVGASRIYLGVHNPSDVLAGYIAGFWLFATTILVDKTIQYFRLIRESANNS